MLSLARDKRKEKGVDDILQNLQQQKERRDKKGKE